MRRFLLTAWSADLFVIALLAIGTLAYAYAIRKNREHARPIFFGMALVFAIIALASPLAVLARGVLFSAHMLQHLILVLVVPPLVLLSLPYDAAPANNVDHTRRALRFLPSWGLGVGAMWLWHAPTLCNAASQSESMQRAQTLSLLVMGAAFFWPVFGTRAVHRLSTFGAMAYLFTACAACSVLGILITFSPVEVCSVFAHPVDRFGILSTLRNDWGLTVKADQEVGGLLMWVPGCLVYAGCIVVTYGRYARGERSLRTREVNA